MGRFRRTIEGLTLGAAMMAGEEAALAQQPRTPEKTSQAEKASFIPKTGFEELLKRFDVGSSKNSMDSLAQRIAGSEKRIQEFLAQAKGNEEDSLVQGEKGRLEFRQQAYEIMKRLEIELQRQEKYKASKDAKDLESLQINASSLNSRYIGAKGTLDSAKRMQGLLKDSFSQKDPEGSGYLGDEAGFFADAAAFVQQMRDYYQTTGFLTPIDRPMPGLR